MCLGGRVVGLELVQVLVGLLLEVVLLPLLLLPPLALVDHGRVSLLVLVRRPFLDRFYDFVFKLH